MPQSWYPIESRLKRLDDRVSKMESPFLRSQLKLVVYSTNHEAARLLVRMLNRREIHQAEILVSNLRNKAHREKERLTKEMFEQNPHIKLWFASSHAKVMSCKTDRGNHYTIEGSANLSYNSRIEQYVIDNDETIYQFTSDWMTEIREYLKNHKELEICSKT